MPALALPTRQIKGYGFRPALRSFLEPVANVDDLTALAEVDPRSELQAWVEDQGQLGSCTANATATNFRYDAALDGHDPGQLSRLWIYRGERQIEGTLGQGDTGAMGHDAFTVARAGIPPESAWPYDISKFENKPPAAAVKAQKHYVLKKSVATVPQSQLAIKRVLSNKQTIALGFTVYESFESQSVATSGIIPMPQEGEQQVGGHEILLCGYLKSEPHYALCMNSWSVHWGIKGFMLMPWAMILDRSLVSDLRTITRPVAA